MAGSIYALTAHELKIAFTKLEQIIFALSTSKANFSQVTSQSPRMTMDTSLELSNISPSRFDERGFFHG